MKELIQWANFYLIVGSAAGALIGLQFVVLTLIAIRPPLRGAEANAAFSTPTIVHLGSVVLLSAILQMPWKTIASVATFLGLIGFGGAIYTIIVSRRMRLQKAYKPVLEDWWFHFVFPFIAYGILSLLAFTIYSYERLSLFGVGFVSLLLLFICIHNAWDASTYNVFDRNKNQNEVENNK